MYRSFALKSSSLSSARNSIRYMSGSKPTDTESQGNLPPVPAAYDWEAMRAEGHKVIDFIFDYHKMLKERTIPCQSEVQPNYLRERIPQTVAPTAPGPFADVLTDVRDHIVPGMTHWQHPDFFAFFPAMLSPPALLGETLSNAFNQPGFNWVASPAATELEVIVTNWLTSAFGLPKEFHWDGSGGCVLQPSATESAIVVMLGAKNRALSLFKTVEEKESAVGKLVAYVTDQSHFCIEKAAKVLSIFHFRKLRTERCPISGNAFLSPAELSGAIEEDVAAGRIPFFVSCNYGATGICAVDPIADLGSICTDRGIWFNVDAAYAGVTAICPELRDEFSGPVGKFADSILINGSKWFSMMFNSSFMFFRDKTHIVSSLNATGTYLANVHTDNNLVVDFKDYHLGLGRPFRALKVYATIKTFGIEGLQSTIRRHILLAKYLHGLLQNVPNVALPIAPRFGLVCFEVKQPDEEQSEESTQRNNAASMKALEYLTTKKRRFLVHTQLGQRIVLRVSLAHPELDFAAMDSLSNDISEAVQHALALRV